MRACHCDHRTCFPCYRQGGSMKEEPMPHFRKGYDERLDLTEDEWLDRILVDDYVEEVIPEDVLPALAPDIEGEPYEDTYLPGIPDYDRFNRPSWGEDE